MAMSGPRPSSELKVSAAARLAARVSWNTVPVIEMTRRAAYNQPRGDWSFRYAVCQISFR